MLRAMLLPLPPNLSRDSWRYLWDARVTLHGFSPYVYAPVDKALWPLIDNVLFPNSRFRTAPTIYPPGAQGIFLLSYILCTGQLIFPQWARYGLAWDQASGAWQLSQSGTLPPLPSWATSLIPDPVIPFPIGLSITGLSIRL